MRFRRPEHEGQDGEGGFGSFLRSLLSGIPWSERAEAEEITTLRPPSSGLLRVNNANGSTRVIGEDRKDVRVRATKVARAECAEAAAELLESIRLIHSNGHSLGLEVDVPSKWNRRGHVNLEISVPSGTSVEVIASNGRIGVECLRASVRARSSNGAVDICDVVGNVEIATSNAKVCCTCTRGRLVARSSNGKIELDEHRGSIDASTSNGLIRATMEAMGEDGIQLATSNGRIVLELPEKVDGEVDIRVDNGIIRNERKLCKATRERTGQLRGRLGAGGAPIKLRTSNGSVSLR